MSHANRVYWVSVVLFVATVLVLLVILKSQPSKAEIEVASKANIENLQQIVLSYGQLTLKTDGLKANWMKVVADGDTETQLREFRAMLALQASVDSLARSYNGSVKFHQVSGSEFMRQNNLPQYLP